MNRLNKEIIRGLAIALIAVTFVFAPQKVYGQTNEEKTASVQMSNGRVLDGDRMITSGDYVYFTKLKDTVKPGESVPETCVYRKNIKTGKSQHVLTLDSGVSDVALNAVYKKKLYFSFVSSQNEYALGKIDLNGTNMKQIIKGYFRFAIYRDKIYCLGINDNPTKKIYITRCDLNGKSVRKLYRINSGVSNVVAVNGFVYYNDADDKNQTINRINVKTGKKTIVKKSSSSTTCYSPIGFDNGIMYAYYYGSGKKDYVIYAINLKNKTKKKIYTFKNALSQIEGMVYYNGNIYTSKSKNRNLYAYNIKSGKNKKVYSFKKEDTTRLLLLYKNYAIAGSNIHKIK